MIDRIVDRALNRTVRPGSWPVPPDVASFHEDLSVVDLLVGTPLFRRGFLARLDHGHVDLPRARLGGLDVIGFTIATRFNDLQGTLSTPHFLALGLPPSILDDDLAIAEAFLDRIDDWVAGIRWSAGLVAAVRGGGRRDQEEEIGQGRRLDRRTPHPMALGPSAEGRCAASPASRAARSWRPTSVASSGWRDAASGCSASPMSWTRPLAGSGTGRVAGGLTGLGREAIAEAERVGVLVDMAHASVPAIEDALKAARRPIVISHTGFTELAGRRSRWRRYSPATRNLPDGVVREAGTQGALVGVTLATDLVGGDSMAAVVRSVTHAIGLVGTDNVAVGSDFDGALRMPFDVRGLPALTGALLGAGLDHEAVAGIMGGNALRFLRSATTVADAPGQAGRMSG